MRPQKKKSFLRPRCEIAVKKSFLRPRCEIAVKNLRQNPSFSLKKKEAQIVKILLIEILAQKTNQTKHFPRAYLKKSYLPVYC